MGPGTKPLDPRYELWNYSQAGFAWGCNGILCNHNCLPSPASDPLLLTILHGTEFNFSVKDIEDFDIRMVM